MCTQTTFWWHIGVFYHNTLPINHCLFVPYFPFFSNAFLCHTLKCLLTLFSHIHTCTHTTVSPPQSPSVNHDLTKTAVEPDKRNAGCGIIFEDKLFVWGGEMDIKGKVGGCRYLPATESNAFDVWDSEKHMWSHQPTWGDVPDLGLGSSLTSYSRWLYLYGGLKEYEENIFAGEIYRISMKTFKWEKIQVPVTAIKPSPRYTMGVILYDHKLCMFGGVGPEIVKDQDPGAKWVEAVNRDKGSFGWNNEYYEFDLTNGTQSFSIV